MNIKKLLFIMVLSLTLIPVQNLFGFEFPALYVLFPFWLFLFLFVLLGKVKVPKVSKIIILVFILIGIEIFISTLVGTTLALNRFYFPNDIIHYIARLLTYLFFSAMFYYGKFSEDFFIKSFLIILFFGMSIGLLQWIPWPGRELLLQMYPFQDGEIQMAYLDRELFIVRIHGWAQFATANGALAMLTFVFSTSVYIYIKKYNYFTITLTILALLNIVISQARAGMLAFVFSIVVMYFVHIYITKRPILSTVKYIVMLAAVFIVTRVLYLSGNPFVERIIYRWEALFQTSGGARVDQIEHGLSLLNNPLNFLFGISRAVQSRSGYIFHIEVEPVNIFVLNGLVGFILQYSLVVFLLVYFARHFRLFRNNPQVTALVVSSFVVLLSYQIFSIAYYFFREIRVGLTPWILIGVTVGVIEYSKKKRRNKGTGPVSLQIISK